MFHHLTQSRISRAELLGKDQGVIEYEFWNLNFHRTDSRASVCRALTEAAEYHGWEIDRLRRDPTGSRTVILRRKVIRMRSTLQAY